MITLADGTAQAVVHSVTRVDTIFKAGQNHEPPAVFRRFAYADVECSIFADLAYIALSPVLADTLCIINYDYAVAAEVRVKRARYHYGFRTGIKLRAVIG